MKFDEWDDAHTHKMSYSKLTMRIEDANVVKEINMYLDPAGAEHLMHLLRLLSANTEINEEIYRLNDLAARKERARAQEEERFRRMEEEARRASDAFRDFGFSFSGSNNNFNYRGHDDRRTGPRIYTPPPQRPKPKSINDQIKELSGVEYLGITQEKFIMRAKRACHPDTGGSHEKWLELDKLIRRL